jgi:hypothetical protein
MAKLDKCIKTENGNLDLCSKKKKKKPVGIPVPKKQPYGTVWVCTCGLLETTESCGCKSLYCPVVFRRG